MATKKIKRFQEGGMSDKERGLEASKDDKVGFFERLRMGNIDDPNSEAYRRFGAGRGRASRVPVEDRVATPVVREITKPESPATAGLMAAGAAAGNRQPSGDASVAEMYSGPRTKPVVTDQPKPGGRTSVNVQATKPTASKPASSNPIYDYGDDRTPAPRSNYSNEGRGKASASSLASQIPTGSSTKSVVGEPTEPMSDAERNINNMMMGAGAGAGIFGLYKKGKSILNARKAAKAGAKKRAALKRDAEEGIDRNLADEVKNYSASAAEKAVKAKQLAAKTKAERSRDLNAGQAKTKFTSTSKTPSKKTKKFNDESNIEFKRGGSVSSASKRGDGIATRGKTNCKMR